MNGRLISRRDFLASGLVVVGATLVGPALWRGALGQRLSDGPYGPLREVDRNGISLPEGFSSRVVARSGRQVASGVPREEYRWHRYPDGGACFRAEDEGWIYVSNSEVGDGGGGVGAIRFDADGQIADAYSIATGTSRNCSGGATPWDTWLTCEETERGRVLECDPFGEEGARPLPALGRFRHEAAAVDPVNEHVYLTEDEPDGRFYRFVPDDYPSLERGTLQVAQVTADGAVRWRDVPDPSAADEATRRQVAASTRFDGGEGTWYDDDSVYFTTKGDDRVWAYDIQATQVSLVHDPQRTPSTPLRGVDNIAGSPSGDLFVAEDGGDLEIVMLTPSGEIAPLLRVLGPDHKGSELAGPALAPDGSRFYFSSQRGFDEGITYEITGPFRHERIERGVSQASPQPLPLDDEDGGLPAGAVAAIAAAGAGATTLVAGRRRRAARRASRSDA